MSDPIQVVIQPPAPIVAQLAAVGPPGPPGASGFVVIEPGGSVPPGTPPGTVIIEPSA